MNRSLSPRWLTGLAIATVLLGLSSCDLAASDPATAPNPPAPSPATSPPAGSLEAWPDSGNSTQIQANVQLDVTAEAGTCPATVGMWEFTLGFEGGADHTVVVDTVPIAAQIPQITQSEERLVVYTAPLQPEFADCVGTARSDQFSMYTVEFAEGQVQFRLDLVDDDGFRAIRFADISANRPYVHWRAAE